jgi:hypothetical protein
MPEVTLPGRIEDEIAFTEKWANRQGNLFYGLAVFKVVAAASIPVILSIDMRGAKIWSGILGGLVAIVETFTTSYGRNAAERRQLRHIRDQSSKDRIYGCRNPAEILQSRQSISADNSRLDSILEVQKVHRLGQ